MDSSIREALVTLGFDGDLCTVPPMKDIRRKWLKLSLTLHPDKTQTGDSKNSKSYLMITNWFVI